jgi:hypothetical protein
MLRLSVKTKLSPEEAIKRAVKFFGPEGLNLEVKDECATSATFEGGGGGVEVSACTEDKKTSVELVSREWDYQVRKFAEDIS